MFPSSRALREEDEEAIFPDRPSTADSATGGIYAESMASSMAHEAYGAGRDDLVRPGCLRGGSTLIEPAWSAESDVPSDDVVEVQGVQVSSFANMFGGALPEGPDGDQVRGACPGQ